MAKARTDPHDSSRDRLLSAAKTLFARQGYEQTSTSAIAAEAGTSESQLVRAFRGKLGLLEALFDANWGPLNQQVQAVVADAPTARGAIVGVLSLFIRTFSRDPELASIFLLEGRRLRAGSEQAIVLSAGFRTFADLMGRLIARGQQDLSFALELDAAAVASALIGASENMIRDRLLARRGGHRPPFTDEQVTRVLESLLDGLAPRDRAGRLRR